MTDDGRGLPSLGLPGPLADLRVLELADEKGQFCGKLMADLGADVIKIEPPGGETTRTVGPFLDDIPHRERSLYFWHYNTSKRGITLSLETADGRELFRRLTSRADVILETRAPGYLPSLGLGYQDLAPSNPKLIMCSLTPFGQTGPWRDYATSDLTHLAAGGQMASSGYDEEDVPGSPPIAPGGGNAWHIGGHYAYIAIMAAIVARDTGGRGQHIDASIHGACALTTEGAVGTYLYSGQVMYRHTGRHHTTFEIDLARRGGMEMATKDGKHIHLGSSDFIETPAGVRRLGEWMDTFGMAQDLLGEAYQTVEGIAENREQIYRVLADFCLTMTQDDLYHGGQAAGCPWGAVRSADEMADDPHLRDRGFYVEVEHPELGRAFTYPGTGAIYNGSPWHISRRAPLVGEHNEEILCGELGISRQELTALSESGGV